MDLPGGAIQGYQEGPYMPNRCLLRLHAWDNVSYINSEMLWLDALAGEVVWCAQIRSTPYCLDPKRTDEHGPWRDESGERLLEYYSLKHHHSVSDLRLLRRNTLTSTGNIIIPQLVEM